MSFLTHLVLPNFCTNNIIKALALKCRYLHYYSLLIEIVFLTLILS